MPFCFLKNKHLKDLIHLKVIIFPNNKIITNPIRQSVIIDEELLSKANNKFFAPDEFNQALKKLANRTIFPIFLDAQRIHLTNDFSKRAKKLSKQSGKQLRN